MLTVLVNTIVNTNNNTLAKNYCWYQYQYCFWKVLPIPIQKILLWRCFLLFITFSNFHFFPRSFVNEVKQNDCCREHGKMTIVYSDMMLMSKHCSSIYFRCKTTVLVFTLSVTVTLLLTT